MEKMALTIQNPLFFSNSTTLPKTSSPLFSSNRNHLFALPLSYSKSPFRFSSRNNTIKCSVSEVAEPVTEKKKLMRRADIRNIAIVAHVDHGKTTLVDAMLKQTKVFRDNQFVQERIMDSNDLERERGITILSKNTSVTYKDAKINIIDTPGHSDFGGEVERILNMVEGILLVVDSVEGPMPQTRFVLKKALEFGHAVVVVVNKIDRPSARPDFVVNSTFELFIELNATDEQCDFQVIYASGIKGKAGLSPENLADDLGPLFESIMRCIPGPRIDKDGSLQMLTTSTEYDEHKGRIAIGRLEAGVLEKGMDVKICTPEDSCRFGKVSELYVYDKFNRVPAERVEAGDICAVCGITDIQIGETIADKVTGKPLPSIKVEEPTVKMSFSINTSPFVGREGKYVTSRNLRDRLYREIERNLAMKVEDGETADTFVVSGRGTLHITILIENMRREGYEFMVGPPKVINKKVNDKVLEPYEVDHLFRHRINSSVLHASNYVKQFPSPIISIIAKFISFVSGGFAAILIIIAFLEESLLEGHIFGRNLFWYAAVFGTITAISRAAIADELLVLDPEGAVSMVVQHTHYMPKRWRGKESTEMVRMEFETLFQYTGMMLLEDMASIFLTPYLLLFIVPKQVDDILQFIAEFTVNVEGVGHVCSFSTFDFQEHGNSHYGSPYNAPCSRRSSQGKMEKSLLSFQSSYPSWEPNTQGKQFLLNLRTFRERKLSVHANRHTSSPTRMWRGSPNIGSNGARDRFVSAETPLSTFVTGNHLGSLWLIEANQNSHPYLLDWYYTSRPHDVTSSDVPIEPFGVTEPYSRDYWMPSNLTQKEPIYEEYSNEYREDRATSHLGASTSAPIFRESLIQDQDSNELSHPTRSHWWDRSNPQGRQAETSFFEPPDFNHRTTSNDYDKFSDRGSDDQDQEQRIYWRDHHKLSRTTCTDDLEAGEFNLHFGDIYNRPPETPTINTNTASF